MKKNQTQIREVIANRLKLAREKKGFATSKDFCQTHSFEWDRYVKHEEGVLSMVASEIAQYCDALEISMSYLVVGENLQKPGEKYLRRGRGEKTKKY